MDMCISIEDCGLYVSVVVPRTSAFLSATAPGTFGKCLQLRFGFAIGTKVGAQARRAMLVFPETA